MLRQVIDPEIGINVVDLGLIYDLEVEGDPVHVPRHDRRSSARIAMTYIVTEPCIHCKHTDCVEVCPVDCFYEGPNFLAIHPNEDILTWDV